MSALGKKNLSLGPQTSAFVSFESGRRGFRVLSSRIFANTFCLENIAPKRHDHTKLYYIVHQIILNYIILLYYIATVYWCNDPNRLADPCLREHVFILWLCECKHGRPSFFFFFEMRAKNP